MTTAIVAPRKLIEVAIPLDDINRAAAREKSIRHGHPSMLHLWWARRPLAVARAVLFAQLVNDPSWKYTPQELRKPQIKSAITRKRNELFKLISGLVEWDNLNDPELLARARAEILSSWRETCEANKQHPDALTLFDPEKHPAFHDPFSGGGAIPLEAQRLGLRAHATDLNPIAVVLNTAMIDIPARFAGVHPVGPLPATDAQTKSKASTDWSRARGLAEDVRRYGAWIRSEALRRIGHLYTNVKIPKDIAKTRPDLNGYGGRELKVIAWLWTRTIKSSNPAFSDVDVPLVSSFNLSTIEGKETWVEPIVKGRAYSFVVRTGKPKDPDSTAAGTKLARGANFKCLVSGSPIAPEHIYKEANAGRMGARLLAIVAEGERGRIYLSPTQAAADDAMKAQPKWKPSVPMPDNPRWFSPPLYGLKTYGDLFTPRQLVALTTLSDLAQEVRQVVKRDALAANMSDDGRSLSDGGTGATAYADAISVYLALGVDKAIDYNSSLVAWSPTRDQAKTTFGRQALPMIWDFAEINMFAGAAGDIETSLEGISKVLCAFGEPKYAGVAFQADAQTQTESDLKVVSTDPPYYDNIGYADLSDFFYVWLRRSLRPVLPHLFETLAVPKAELVATPYRHGGKEKAEAFFLDGMTKAMERLSAQSHPAVPVTIYYAFKQSETESETDGTGSTGWETFLDAVIRAGFAVVGTWPMRTERGARSIGLGTNALASSIILVCRARTKSASTVARKDFLRELDKILPIAITEMTADPVAAIAPVDLAQACIGPGMAIFSSHAGVLEADGAPMTIHNALVHINKAIDTYFSEAEGDLDADTRFCIGWFQQRGFDTGPFGEADVLARAKGTSVDGVDEAGVVAAGKGKVRLLQIKEMPKAWDPTKDQRVPIWEACHQMCRALNESEGDAGALLARMPQKEEAIRLLAYRLYTLCERKGWAEQARAYNELITSWVAIVEASHKAGVKGTQMKLM